MTKETRKNEKMMVLMDDDEVPRMEEVILKCTQEGRKEGGGR